MGTANFWHYPQRNEPHSWQNNATRRKLLITGVVLLAIVASSVRISYHALGWGGYWGARFVAPWPR
jgi:hypothetical protein